MFKDNSGNKQRRHRNQTFRDEISGQRRALFAWDKATSKCWVCLICEKDFDPATDKTKLKIAPDWANAAVCNGCRRKNRNGIERRKYPRLDEHLTVHNIAPLLDEQGMMLLPRKYV